MCSVVATGILSVRLFSQFRRPFLFLPSPDDAVGAIRKPLLSAFQRRVFYSIWTSISNIMPVYSPLPIAAPKGHVGHLPSRWDG
jgi:hypothetical protein